MRRAVIGAGLALLAVLVLQCKKKPDTEADKAAVRSLATSDTSFFNANLKTDTTHDTTFVQLGADTTLLWWRNVRADSHPTISVDVVGDSGYVDWARRNYGYIYSLIKVPDTTWQLWPKKIVETARIRGIFRRTGPDTSANRGWRLQKISLASGASDSPAGVVRIDSLRIKSETHPDLVIRDPLNTYYRVDSLLRFTSLELCSLTLYTNVADGDAFLHSFLFIWYVRSPFTRIGDGVYTGAWRTQLLEFPRFAIFDFMDHRTLYTQSYGYDYSGWLLPYRIKNTD
jgi:hypothetical protein